MDFLEADIVLTPHQKLILNKRQNGQDENGDDIHKRAVITELYLTWKNGIVPYVYASSIRKF